MYPGELPQNLLSFWNTKIMILVIFIFHFILYALFPSKLNATKNKALLEVSYSKREANFDVFRW